MSWWPRQMPRVGVRRATASRTSCTSRDQPRMRIVVVGAHRPAQHEQGVVAGEVVGERVAGVRASYVEPAPRLAQPLTDQRRRAVVLVLDDQDAAHHGASLATDRHLGLHQLGLEAGVLVHCSPVRQERSRRGAEQEPTDHPPARPDLGGSQRSSRERVHGVEEHRPDQRDPQRGADLLEGAVGPRRCPSLGLRDRRRVRCPRAVRRAGRARPRPPPSVPPGSSGSGRPRVLDDARSTHHTPAACSNAPARQTVLPSLSPSGTEIPVPTNAPRLNGSSIRPASNALNPRPAWT